MKIRQGFVSNSSSSSFAALGWYTDVSEIDDEHVQIIFSEEVLYGDYGPCVGRPDKKTIEYIKNHPDEDIGDYFYVLFKEGETTTDKLVDILKKFPSKDIELLAMETSQGYPEFEYLELKDKPNEDEE